MSKMLILTRKVWDNEASIAGDEYEPTVAIRADLVAVISQELEYTSVILENGFTIEVEQSAAAILEAKDDS